MSVGYVKGIAEVHLKGVASPKKAVLDEGCQELCSVEKICGCDPEGMGAPARQGWVFGREAVRSSSN